jgi:tRNA A37 threonylcarbamoyladenosine biosynthesis protein TsaE
MNKKSEYKKARKMIIENDGLIHLIGDYGIGKTYLINDIIKNE